MTDDEGLLCDLAYPLIEPPFVTIAGTAWLGEYGPGPARKFALPHAAADADSAINFREQRVARHY